MTTETVRNALLAQALWFCVTCVAVGSEIEPELIREYSRLGGREIGVARFLSRDCVSTDIPMFRFTAQPTDKLPHVPVKFGLELHKGVFSNANPGAELAQFAHLENIEALKLHWSPEFPLRQLHQFKKLRHLEIGGIRLSVDSLREIARIETLETLEGSFTGIDDPELAVLAEMPNLKHLDLRWTGITGEFFNTTDGFKKLSVLVLGEGVSNSGLKGIGRLKTLESLYLRRESIEDGFTDEGLAELSHLPNLKSLDLMLNPKLGDRGYQIVGGLTSLQSLSPSAGTTDAQAAKLANLKQLRHLSICSYLLTAKGLSVFYGFEKLESLNLTGCSSLEDPGFDEINKLKHLKSLILDFAPVTDHGIRQIARLKSLEVLTFHRTQATDASVEVLGTMTHLRELGIDGKRLTMDNLKQLDSLLPKTDVTYTTL